MNEQGPGEEQLVKIPGACWAYERGDMKNFLEVESVAQQIPSNPYVGKDYFSSKYCHCNEKLFIVTWESPKPWRTGMLYDLSAQSVLSQELVLFASPSCPRQVIPQPGKKENCITWLTQPGRHLGCLHQSVQGTDLYHVPQKAEIVVCHFLLTNAEYLNKFWIWKVSSLV